VFVLGYEEALGYSAGSVVRDKDGVSAVMLAADLAAFWKNRGKSMLDALDALCRTYGVHASKQLSITLPGAEGAARIQALMQALRTDRIEVIAGVPVSKVTDVQRSEEVELQTGVRRPVRLPRSDVLAWTLNDGSRILARPSGTEPKIKFYFEVIEPLASVEKLAHAEARAGERLAKLERGLREVAHL
jgi:phosphomannomutase